MDDNKLGLQMWGKALDFLDKRFPRDWGGDVKIAVTNPTNRVMFKTLNELDPYYWGDAFPDDDREEYQKEEMEW